MGYIHSRLRHVTDPAGNRFNLRQMLGVFTAVALIIGSLASWSYSLVTASICLTIAVLLRACSPGSTVVRLVSTSLLVLTMATAALMSVRMPDSLRTTYCTNSVKTISLARENDPSGLFGGLGNPDGTLAIQNDSRGRMAEVLADILRRVIEIRRGLPFQDQEPG